MTRFALAWTHPEMSESRKAAPKLKRPSVSRGCFCVTVAMIARSKTSHTHILSQRLIICYISYSRENKTLCCLVLFWLQCVLWLFLIVLLATHWDRWITGDRCLTKKRALFKVEKPTDLQHYRIQCSHQTVGLCKRQTPALFFLPLTALLGLFTLMSWRLSCFDGLVFMQTKPCYVCLPLFFRA